MIERHQKTYGTGPIGAWHPASHNTDLRHLYWIEVDRSIWRDLSDLVAAAGDGDEAAPWLGKVLNQTPGQPDLLQRLMDIYGDSSGSTPIPNPMGMAAIIEGNSC